MQDEIIVVGAGAAGLMVARKLSREGKQVRIIEARDRAGGRILTTNEDGFSARIEAGAEFIHGNLVESLRLLEEANIQYHATSGALYSAREEEAHKQNDFIEHQKLFAKKLSEVTQDISVQDFLDLYFPGEKYSSLRKSIEGYVQGYDLADLDKSSTLSLKEEWLEEDDDQQYRIDDGYGAIINYLLEDCKRNNCQFEFNSIVKKVDWKRDYAKIFTSDGRTFECQKLIIAVPLGIWHSKKGDAAHIEYNPSLPGKLDAAQQMGYGDVVKIIIEFNDPFWENEEIVGKKRMKNLGFVFGNTRIPTWWTQAPAKTSILTGWFGGPPVRNFKKLNNEGILQLATDSLSKLFQIDHSILLEKMVAWRVYNWAMDEFSLGGYAFPSLDRHKHIVVLAEPTSDTIFISGEALWGGPEVGTVEAAFRAALTTAEQVMQSYPKIAYSSTQSKKH